MTSATRPSDRADRTTRAAASTRLSVLSTKLEPPYPRPGITERPRLSERVRSVQTPLVALIAPAGYGKSILLAQAGLGDGRPFAWFSADGRDTDAAVLCRGIAAAIDRLHPLPEPTVHALETPGPNVWATAVPRLMAALTHAPAMTVAIDDVDRIDDDEALSVILTLADHLPPGSRLLLGGRTPGRLPLPRLVAERRLTVLGREDLALDGPETRALLEAAGHPLPADEIQRLVERTEGWAAGIYLTALADGATRDADAGLSPTAPERQVEDYLRSEVLAAMDAGDAELLLRAALLDRFSGALCDAVLDRSGSGAALDRLERTNLFLIPLDRDRTWFRCHHLLGEFLRRELERREPAAVTETWRRAAAWHEDHGLPEAALEYALAAGDEDRAARVTVTLARSAMNSGRASTARRWFQWFDDRQAGTRQPRLAAHAALIFALDGDVERAERWIGTADEVIGSDDPVAGVHAVVRSVICRRGVAAMAEDAKVACDVVPDGDEWRVAALTVMGIACRLAGDGDGAQRHLTEAVARNDLTSVANIGATLALGQLAASALERGDRVEGERCTRKARRLLLANGLAEVPIALGIDALDARLAMAHGAAEQARSALTHAQRLRPHVGLSMPWLAVHARLDLVRAYLALGDVGGARTIMAEVRDILAVRPDMGTLLHEQAELEVRLQAIRGGVTGSSTLTIAELRLLPLLTTHLSFREIGARLYVSQNTVKTQAISIYRKLDATSRGEAIERAVALGLLESSVSLVPSSVSSRPDDARPAGPGAK